MTEQKTLDAILSKLEALEEGQKKLTAKVDKLATDTDEKITGLYRHTSDEIREIREQLTRMEEKQDKTAETIGYVIQDVYLLQKKTGGGNR